MDCPASKRSSASASDVSTATRSRTTDSTIVCENDGLGVGPFRAAAPRERRGGPAVLLEQDDDGALGREEVEEQVDDLREICPTSRASMSVRATRTIARDLFTRRGPAPRHRARKVFLGLRGRRSVENRIAG